MSRLPRQFVITGPRWERQTHYIVDLNDVDHAGHVRLTFAPGHAISTYPDDYEFRSYTEADVRRYIDNGSWVIVEDLTQPTVNIEDLI